MAIESKFEKIGPDKAYAYLETMTGNRNVRQRNIDYLAAQMKAGLWRRTHQGIAFDAEGHLIDGQHRMWAVIESGVTIETMVTRGVAAEDVAVVDGGLARDFNDVAHYSGWELDNNQATIAKILVLGPGLAHRKIPPEVLVEWHGFYRDQVDFANKLRLSCRPTTGKSITLFMAAAFARAYPHVGPEMLARFGEVLKSGQITVEADRAAFVLRDAWLTSRLGKSATEQYLKTEAAIRAFADRRPVRKLQKPDAELYEIKKLPTDKRFALVNSEKSPRTSKKARAKLREKEAA